MKRVALTHNPLTVIDDEDYEAVIAAGPWHFALCGDKLYAQRVVDGRTERLHTFLTGWPLVDHINGDGLDNRRVNLRPAIPQQNAANSRRPRHNTSGFKGVSLHKHSGLWRAYISAANRHIGYFHTPEEAARAYDAAAIELYGKFARLNFPEGISA